jgi:antitoxin MazE
MKVKLVAIGNSRGVRLPKTVIEQCGFGDEVELEVARGRVVLRPRDNPRAGWDAAFKRMHEAGDDRLLDEDVASRLSEWDQKEWKW